jgi:hypothetical protein
MPDIDPELQAEQALDAKYLEELNHYVNTLSAPSAESVALYRAKLSKLEEIHAEIRAKYPDFMPVYDPLSDPEYNQALGKYQENTYSFSSRDLHNSSNS